MHERLVQARIDKGYKSAAAAARAFGWKELAYSTHENGTRGFASSADKYAKAYGVTLDWLVTGKANKIVAHQLKEPVENFEGLQIRGKVQAGTWLEIDEDAFTIHDISHLNYHPNDKYPADKQYALEVVGDSVNKLILEGHYAICVCQFGVDEQFPQVGDLVVVERLRHDGSMREVTIKRYMLVDGRHALVPESTNQKFQTINPDEEVEEGTDIKIIAKVIDAIAGGF